MSFVKRMNYFPNEMLNTEDFETEQAYHRDMRHKHNRTLHSSGIAEGFSVKINLDSKIEISSGDDAESSLAIDGKGKEIYLPEDEGSIIIENDEIVVYQSITDEDTVYEPTSGTSHTVYLTIFLDEVKEDLQSEGVDTPTAKKTVEKPGIKFFLTEPVYTGTEDYVDEYLLLAKMTLTYTDETGWSGATGIDTTDQKTVTVAMQQIKAHEFVLTDTNDNEVYKLGIGLFNGTESFIIYKLPENDIIFAANAIEYGSD